MPWIILTDKLPVHPSPPKLSIFYATPWPMDSMLESQRERFLAYDKGSGSNGLFLDDFGYEPDASKALKIRYKTQDIRVWRHECNDLPEEKLQDYLTVSHQIVGQNSGAAILVEHLLDPQTDIRLTFDAATLDGAYYSQALCACLGMDPDNPPDTFGDIFWWRCRPEYAQIWCDDQELLED